MRSVRTRNRSRGVAALTLAIALAFPVLVTAGPAYAAPGGQKVKPAAAPVTSLLLDLNNLLARLFPVPTPAPGVPASLLSQVAPSTVRVNGVACGSRFSGSGFSPAPDTIVTNAHVVAGSTRTQVLRPDGRTLPAIVSVFDPVRDLAVLSVPGLGQPSLGLASAVLGETGAVFGYPRGQVAVEASPARVARRVIADVGDIYERPSTPRQILVLNSDLEPGDSGAPLVNSAGKVVGVAFAVANFSRSTAYAVAAEELAPVLARPRAGAVSTGPCLIP